MTELLQKELKLYEILFIQESRLLSKARQLGVNVPHLYYVDNNQIIMMYIDGVKLKDYLNNLEKENKNNEI